MPNGATTLSQGVSTFSLNLGADLPEPLGYSLRFDHGVTDKLQLGVSGGYWGDVGTAALHSRMNLLESSDRRHYFGVEFDVGYVHADESLNDKDEDIYRSDILSLQPNFAYEFRLGAERRTGIFLKAGSIHLFDLDRSDTGEGGRFLAGIQHRFGESFSMTLHGGVLVPGAVVLTKLGFAWAY